MKREITLFKILLLLAAVFVVEMFVMLVLFQLEAHFPSIFRHRIIEAVVDPLMLSVLIGPFIYVLLVRPMQVSNSMKSRFLDLVSDQLRNPLNALQGLEAIDENSPDDPLRKARSNAVSMLQFRVDHIIAFSALQADEPLACNNVHTLADLGTEAHRRIGFAFDAAGTGLDIAPDLPDLPLEAIDAETLLQILLLMLEIAMITSGTSSVTLGAKILGQAKRGTRARILVTHDGNAHADSADPESYDRIDMAWEIASHMARRIGARVRMERGRTLVLEITLPTTAIPS